MLLHEYSFQYTPHPTGTDDSDADSDDITADYSTPPEVLVDYSDAPDVLVICRHPGCYTRLNVDVHGDAIWSCHVCSIPLCPDHAYSCPSLNNRYCDGYFCMHHASRHPCPCMNLSFYG